MKIIFSRKGVDSAAGKCASTLVGDRPISIPIPTRQPSSTTYGMLEGGLADLTNDLSRGILGPGSACHLDPDIDCHAVASRPNG